MHGLLGQGIIMLLAITFFLYSIVNHKFMSRPTFLVALGFSLCLSSALTISIADTLSPLIRSKENIAAFGILKNMFALSIASLGGGLISSGLILKAQIEHNRKIFNLKKQLSSICTRLSDLNAAKAKNESSWDDKTHVQYTSTLLKHEKDKTDIITELEKMGWIDGSNHRNTN
ncbi:TPA: hypothetical protein ACSP33_003703 [Aeromonas veronii]